MQRVEPLCYTPVATIGGDTLQLAWHDGRGYRCVGLAPARRKEWQAVYLSAGPRGCVASQEDGVSEALEISQPVVLSMPGSFCSPALSPEQQALCNLCPFSVPLAAGKSSNCLPFFCPRDPVVHTCSP